MKGKDFLEIIRRNDDCLCRLALKKQQFAIQSTFIRPLPSQPHALLILVLANVQENGLSKVFGGFASFISFSSRLTRRALAMSAAGMDSRSFEIVDALKGLVQLAF